MAKTPAWTRKEGKNPEGGLNAKGRASYNKANPGKPGLKAPQPEGGPLRPLRASSFTTRRLVNLFGGAAPTGVTQPGPLCNKTTTT